ncbi:MAG: gliding motility protein GldN [Sphingobacteriales bacterium]|nr:gliding motility protein GldN [Sphingobacteriales bacterium]MBI3720172.1 gliding motility protein GldN [Sphingobacteriales bacterium]
MKIKIAAVALLAFGLVMNVTDINAQQRTKKKKGTTTKKTTQSAYGNQSQSAYGNQTQSAYGNQTQSANLNNNNSGSQPRQSNIPYEVQKSTSGGWDSASVSLRNDASIERNLVRDREPLAYEHIREDDAVYRQRVWREIDIREKMNLPFRYSANEDNGNQRFIAILVKAIKDSVVTAFDPIDDRFTTPLPVAKAMNQFGGGMDTVPSYDLNGNLIKYVVTPKEVDPDSITKFRIKEEWVFDKESSRMFVRILGIAPLKKLQTSTGITIGDEDIPMFWVYYPDMRPVLAKYEAYNNKNFGGRMTWEELFENRFFASYITKSTLDNPYDLRLKAIFKDPILRLLEGDNIKEKIFNYEQDLWSY